MEESAKKREPIEWKEKNYVKCVISTGSNAAESQVRT